MINKNFEFELLEKIKYDYLHAPSTMCEKLIHGPFQFNHLMNEVFIFLNTECASYKYDKQCL